MLRNYNIADYFQLVLFPIIIFFLGYFSNELISWNYDVFYLHSSLLVILILTLFVLNKITLLVLSPKYFEIICIAIISCFTLGVVLITVQDNLLYTRWLDLGLFPSNDAEDYVQQSYQYLLKGNLYSNKGRIVFPIIYSGLLAEYNLNVKVVQLIITFLTAIITFLSSIVIYQKYGFLCSIIFSGLCADFLIEHVGGANTENIGYIFGGIAFIFYFKFINIKKTKLINYIVFFACLLLGYLIRPSIPLILPFLCVWAFFYLSKYSKKEAYKIVIASFFSLFFILFANKILLEKKSPNTAKEFGNIYDSWYATHELGKYYLNNKYDDIPGTLWTKIFIDYPIILGLKGKEFVKAKRDIVISTFISNPEYYAVGSLLQIKNFFNKSKNYIERFDHSSGFLFIEFIHYRIILLILFTLGGLLSLLYFLKYKEKYFLLILLIFLATLLSQPFIFGGEARTVSTVIFFVNLVIVFTVNTLKIKTFNYKAKIYQKKISYENLNLTNISSYLSMIPLFFLFFIFIKAINNNYTYLKKQDFDLNLTCEEGKTLKLIIFNSKSGFFVNSYQKETKKYHKDFSEILDVYADKSVILEKNKFDITFSMTREEINKRDTFKILENLILLHNGRIFELSEREKLIYSTLTTQFLTAEAFYVKPINFEKKTSDDIILLEENSVSKGLNRLAICV